MVALAALSLAVYTAGVVSVPVETWRRPAGGPGLRDTASAVGTTALVLLRASALLDALVANGRDAATGESNARILSSIAASAPA